MTRREYTTRTIEHTIDAAPPYGACFSEIGKAIAIAQHEYRHLHNLATEQDIPDDAIAVFAGDDELIIRFIVTKDVPR